MSIRPKVGGFPFLAEVLRHAGVLTNRWSLPSCQSISVMSDGAIVQQGSPLLLGNNEIPKFDRDSIITAIRADQQGQSTFSEFLLAVWRAGVVAYKVDFVDRKVTYYGVSGENYQEDYPKVAIPKSNGFLSKG